MNIKLLEGAIKSFRNKYLALALILLSSFHASAQWIKPNNSYGTIENGREVKRVLLYPTGCGAPFALNSPDSAQKMSAIYFDSCGHVVFVWDPSLNLWDTLRGSGGGSGIDSIVYVKDDLTVDRTTNPPHQTLGRLHNDGLISGGVVTGAGGMNVQIPSTSVYLNHGNVYTSPSVILTVSASDPTYDRKDLVVIDTLGHIIIITGTASSIPNTPYHNPASQWVLSEISVPHGATSLTINIIVIYDETGGTEYTPSTSGTITANASNTDNPKHLTKADFVSVYHDGSKRIFTKSSGQDTVFDNSLFKWFHWFNNPFHNNLQMQLFNNGVATSSNIIVNSYLNIFDTLEYQVVAIPRYAFGGAGNILVDSIVFTLAGSDTSGVSGYYIDWLQLQTGVTNGSGTIFTPNFQQVMDVENGHATMRINDTLDPSGHTLFIRSINPSSSINYILDSAGVHTTAYFQTAHRADMIMTDKTSGTTVDSRVSVLPGEVTMVTDHGSTQMIYHQYEDYFIWNNNTENIFSVDGIGGGARLFKYTPGSPLEVSDTTTNKPIVVDATGNLNRLSYWPGGGSAHDSGTSVTEQKIYYHQEGVKDKSINTSTGAIGTNSGTDISDLIPITPNESITISAFPGTNITIYGHTYTAAYADIGEIRSNSLIGTPLNSYTFTTPSNAAYLNLYVNYGGQDFHKILRVNSTATITYNSPVTPEQFTGTPVQKIQGALDFARYTTSPVEIKGNYSITSALIVSSGTTVVLNNAHLQLDSATHDNIFRNEAVKDTAHKFLRGNNNIKIIGTGSSEIQGSSSSWSATNLLNRTTQFWRIYSLLFSNVQGFQLSGLNFKATNFTPVGLEWSRDGNVNNMHLNQGLEHTNQGGLLIYNGSKRIIVNGLSGSCFDDMVEVGNTVYDSVKHLIDPTLFPSESPDDSDIHFINLNRDTTPIYAGTSNPKNYTSAFRILATGLRKVHWVTVTNMTGLQNTIIQQTPGSTAYGLDTHNGVYDITMTNITSPIYILDTVQDCSFINVEKFGNGESVQSAKPINGSARIYRKYLNSYPEYIDSVSGGNEYTSVKAKLFSGGDASGGNVTISTNSASGGTKGKAFIGGTLTVNESTNQVGINNTSPDNDLLVNTSATGGGISINSQTTGWAALGIRLDNTVKFISGVSRGSNEIIGGSVANDANLRVQGGNLNFTTNSGASIQWQINTSGHFLPGANNTFDFGSPSLRPRVTYTNAINAYNLPSSTGGAVLVHGIDSTIKQIPPGTAGQVLHGDLTWKDTTAAGPFSGWGVTGNTGIASATQFIGTTDSAKFKVKTKGIDAIVVDSSQNVGISSLTSAKLSVIAPSQTGSSANSALYVSQTWNTTGKPSAFKIDVSDIAVGGCSGNNRGDCPSLIDAGYTNSGGFFNVGKGSSGNPYVYIGGNGGNPNGPGYYAGKLGDTESRIVFNINNSDQSEISFGPGNASRDFYIKRVASGDAQITGRVGIGMAPTGSSAYLLQINGAFTFGDGTNTLGRSTYTAVGGNPALASGSGKGFTFYVDDANTRAMDLSSTGQMIIGGTSTSASSILTTTSTTKGVLFSTMTASQRDAISSPATMLQVSNTTTNGIDYYNGSAWVRNATWGYKAITATYTITNLDYTLEATSGTFTATLPDATGSVKGRVYIVTNTGAGTVTLGTTSSQTFMNVSATPTTLTLAQYNTVTVQSNGTGWLRLTNL